MSDSSAVSATCFAAVHTERLLAASCYCDLSPIHGTLHEHELKAEIDRLKAEHGGEEDYLDVLLDWADSEEGIKSQLKELRQRQTETQQSIVEVRQTQLQEIKTLEDSQTKLQELHQIKTTTQQTAEDVRQTQLEVHKALQGTKSKLDEVHQTDSNIDGTVERIHQTQLEDRETLQDNKSKLEEVH
ncbi:hypothetical protein ACROYT_G031003 [Oculina patagonica]